jgi:hypothetical protein
MASRGSMGMGKVSIHDIFSFPELTAHNIAALCPAAAEYSLHLPLHQCNDQVMRILRFVESECEVLPSKERCPYLVTAELIPQSFNCKSSLLYAQGAKPAVALERGGIDNMAQVTYSGQARLTASSPNSVASAEEIATPTPQPSEYDGYNGDSNEVVLGGSGAESAEQQPVLRTSYRYGVRRRGSLLSDSLAQHRSAAQGHSSAVLAAPRRPVLAQRAAAPPSPAGPGAAQREADSLLEDGLEQAYAVLNSANAIAHELEDMEVAEEGNEVDKKMDALAAHTDGAHMRMFARPVGGAVKTTAASLPPRSGEEETALDRYDESEDNASSRRSPDQLRGGSTELLPEGATEPLPSRYRSRRHLQSTRRPVSMRERVTSVEAQPPRRTERDDYVDAAFPLPTARGVHATQEQHSMAPRAPEQRPNIPGALPSPYSPQHPDRQLYAQEQQQVRPLRSYVRPKTWAERKAIVRSQSPFGHLQGWDMRSFIVKSGDDMRKEVSPCLCHNRFCHVTARCEICRAGWENLSEVPCVRTCRQALLIPVSTRSSTQVLAMQLMGFCQKVFELEGLDIYLRPYQILR